MRKISMNKRGQVIGLVNQNVIGIMMLIFFVFAALFGIAALNPSGFFTAGSAEANSTKALQANLTAGVDQFGGYIPTGFKVLGVLFALGFVILLVVYIRRMSDAGGTSGGGL